jgi:P-type E1-E2 ATPase
MHCAGYINSIQRHVSTISGLYKVGATLATEKVTVKFDSTLSQRIGLMDIEKAIEALKGLGIETAMVTGDNREIAEGIAQLVGIDRICSDMLRSDKVNTINKIHTKSGKVAIVVMVSMPLLL